MKKYDLYDIALKIFGFYFIVTVLAELKQLVVFLVSARMMGPMMGGAFDSMTLIWPYLLTLVFDIWLAWLFIGRTKKILGIILPKSQSETVEFGLNKPSLVQVACIMVGLLIIVDAIEKTGTSIITMVQMASTPFEVRPVAIPELIWHLCIGVIGYGLVAGSAGIAQRFSGKPVAAEPDASDARFQFGQWKIAPTAFKKKRPVMPKRKQQLQ